MQTSHRNILRKSLASQAVAANVWRHHVAAMLLLLCASSVSAQAPKPAPAEAAAAMERAQRIAANPMRAILQASKLTVASRAEAPGATPRAVAVASALQAVSVVSPAVLVPAVAATPLVVAATKPVEVLFKTESQLGQPAATEVLALEATSAVASMTQPLTVPGPSAALASSVTAPKLTRRVDPLLPQSVLDQIGPLREVKVHLNIQADGSVSDVAVQQPAPRQIVRYVQAAVAQWQFEPLPEPRAHVVQLVFSAE